MYEETATAARTVRTAAAITAAAPKTVSATRTSRRIVCHQHLQRQRHAYRNKDYEYYSKNPMIAFHNNIKFGGKYKKNFLFSKIKIIQKRLC